MQERAFLGPLMVHGILLKLSENRAYLLTIILVEIRMKIFQALGDCVYGSGRLGTI
jgi:hypothetical protein